MNEDHEFWYQRWDQRSIDLLAMCEQHPSPLHAFWLYDTSLSEQTADVFFEWWLPRWWSDPHRAKYRTQLKADLDRLYTFQLRRLVRLQPSELFDEINDLLHQERYPGYVAVVRRYRFILLFFQGGVVGGQWSDHHAWLLRHNWNECIRKKYWPKALLPDVESFRRQLGRSEPEDADGLLWLRTSHIRWKQRWINLAVGVMEHPVMAVFRAHLQKQQAHCPWMYLYQRVFPPLLRATMMTLWKLDLSEECVLYGALNASGSLLDSCLWNATMGWHPWLETHWAHFQPNPAILSLPFRAFLLHAFERDCVPTTLTTLYTHFVLHQPFACTAEELIPLLPHCAHHATLFSQWVRHAHALSVIPRVLTQAFVQFRPSPALVELWVQAWPKFLDGLRVSDLEPLDQYPSAFVTWIVPYFPFHDLWNRKLLVDEDTLPWMARVGIPFRTTSTQVPSAPCELLCDRAVDVINACGHGICYPCLEQWMERSLTCPFCRGPWQWTNLRCCRLSPRAAPSPPSDVC